MTRLLCLALPALIVAFSISEMTTRVTNILYVAIGLGLVIFFHELGHFAVAKWCDVFVERFSIGFGPILIARKWGETEYALSAIPFGGYVKMLGQDDIDSTQLTSEEIAQDPRSYSAKPVWQRMGIISAGVIMNVLTAVLFYAFAFGIGITQLQPIVGSVIAGGPAWEAGIRAGDRIEEINGRRLRSFEDIIRSVVLSSGTVRIVGEHSDGEPFDVSVEPDGTGTRRQVGISPANATQVAELAEGASPILAGSAASRAETPLKAGDRIIAVNGEPIETFSALSDQLARHRAEDVTLSVERATASTASSKASDEVHEIKIGPNKTRTLGIRIEFGRIASVVAGSPAAKAGIQAGDQITRVDGQDVGGELDPMQMPNYFAEKAGDTVTVELQRSKSEGAPEQLTVELVPDDRPGWIERPVSRGEPLAIPAIGVAYHLSPRILSVVAGGPAEKAGLARSDNIDTISLVLPKDLPLEPTQDKRRIDIPMVETINEKTNQNFAYAFTLMQEVPQRHVLVKIRGKKEEIQIEPWSDPNATWYMPTRGFLPSRLHEKVQATGIGDALAIGYEQTVNSVIELYSTLRNLVTGHLSVKELRGPIGIAEIAYQTSRSGTAELLWFLGYLSVNLAVLNFLPIPVLDGGHMVFLIWEAVTRRKPSERAVQYATMVGLFFILALMASVIYMDLFVHKVFQGS